MKIVVAMDSSKGCFSSAEACEAVRRGAARACPEAEIAVLAVADGGEGTVAALARALGAEPAFADVTGPLGEPVRAAFALRGRLAVLETAAAAGLTLVPPEKRDPSRTTTRGLGELIAAAAARGARDFWVGLGGSATNDGGLGMLSALGFLFSDGDGAPVAGTGADAARVARVETDGAAPWLGECRFTAVCDVKNPLCGENGASAVFGPQKGASPETAAALDAGLARLAAVSAAALGRDEAELPGAGAAGGLGWALAEFLNARLIPGAEAVLDAVGLDEALDGADLVFTGEGRLDGQTVMGKTPAGVAARAARAGVPTAALGGCLGPGAERLEECGFAAALPVLDRPRSEEEAMDPAAAAENLARAAASAVRLFCAGRQCRRTSDETAGGDKR